MSIDLETAEQLLNFLIANAVNDSLTMGLSDDLGGEVIHISSTIPQKLNLSIANKLTDEILIVGQPGPASSTNFHFCIQFANNQCFLPPPTPTVTTPGWLMKSVPARDGDFINYIYLLSTETITLKAASPSGDSTTSVGLEYIEATLANSGVEVLTVFVSVGQNVIAKLTPKDQPVSGTETIHLTTFTDASAPTPLIATLVQPRTILDDGTERNLLLRLVNTSPDPIPFLRPPQAGDSTPTGVELSVDLDAGAAWALCNKGEADLIQVTPPANWLGDHAGSIGTAQKTWKFHPDYTQTTRIDAHSALEFVISGVKTTLPPGFTNLYVTLREFPNYGTQSLVTQIEKSPLIYNDGLNSGLLSGGTTGANQGLAINGNTSADLLLVQQSGSGTSAHFKGGTGVSIEKDLVVSGDVRISDRTLWLRKNGDQNHGLGWYGTDKPFAKKTPDGPVLFGFQGGALATTINEQKIALSWDDTGKVSIGANEAKSTLSVNGGVAVGANFANTYAAPANGLLVEGNVGIGTNNPTSTLSVKGGMAVGPTYANSVATPDGLFVEGTVAIGTTKPESPFHVRSNDGIRLGLEGNGGGQLVIGNSPNDNSVQLVASGLTSTRQKHESAALLYLGGWADAQLPKMRLNAKEIDIEAATMVSGKVSAQGLALTGGLTMTGNGDVHNVIELGYLVEKEVSAGKIGYRVFSDGLDIVGATSSIGTRQVHLWDDVYVHGNFWMQYKHGDGSGPFWCQMSTHDGYVNDHNWDYAVFNNLSDARLKKNVTPIESPLERLRKLHGCNYDWNEDAFALFTKGIDTICSAETDATAEKTEALRQSEREKRKEKLARRQVGVIAQDVEAVLPEAVTTDEEGYKSVHHHQLIPLLIEAIKEQDVAVTAQAELLARQQREIERLTQAVERLTQAVTVSV